MSLHFIETQIPTEPLNSPFKIQNFSQIPLY